MNDTISYLYSLESRGIKLGLQRTKKLLESCNKPQKKLRCIQIAGTNGKGSVSAMIASSLSLLGYNVGLYTSPHLISLRERIRINGKPISYKEINLLIDKHKKSIEKNQASFFETMTMLAFNHFINKKVDIAILETGLGGKHDSVTMCNPDLVAFTPISMDHKEILGNTIEKIAEEKFGIIKDKIPIFSSEQNDKVLKLLRIKAKNKACPLFICQYDKKIQPKFLNGEHQQKNAKLAYDIISYLFKIKGAKLIQAIEKTNWYGRYQVLKKKPLIIFDVGHNEDGINSFIDEYKKENIIGNKYLIIVLQKRKKLKKTKESLNAIFDKIICSQTNNKNSMKAEELIKFFDKKSIIVKDVKKAIIKINKNLKKNDSLAIIGSHYLGESIRSVYKNNFEKL